MSQLVSFGISTPSRHPANQDEDAYEQKHHRYRADYVNPEFWILNLTAIPFGLGESENGEPIIPANIKSFEWTVKRGSFSKTVIRGHSSTMMNTEVQIPEPGEYEITLQVNLTNSEPERHTRNYRVRDFLVVGIGDSFASGQGNPDVPAIPSPVQKGFCKATSIALVVSNLKEELLDFANEIKEESNEKIEDYLPFAGKIVVAGLNGVEDVGSVVKKAIDTLTNWTVRVGRGVTTSVVEGVEEVFGFLGIGDGGEFDETKPRPAAWQEPPAYRSYRSGQSLAARQIETETAFGADRITFLSFGRTGSEINHGLLGPRTIDDVFTENVSIDGWIQDRGQIEETRDTVLNRRIDALIITIGVNDLGFSSLVTNSILKASGEKRNNRIRGARNKINTEFPRDLNALKDAIESQLNPRLVFITEYPAGIFKEIAEGAEPCGVLGSTVPSPTSLGGFDLDEPDARQLGELGRLLNDKIREKADEFGWILIDGIERGFDGHGYCARQPYFVSSEESCLNQGDFDGMLHPNKFGHEVARDCIALALRRNLLAPQAKWLEPILNIMMS